MNLNSAVLVLLTGALGVANAQQVTTAIVTTAVVTATDAGAQSTVIETAADGGVTSTLVVGVTVTSTIPQTYTASNTDAASAAETLDAASTATASQLPATSPDAGSSDTSKKIGIGVGVGVGVPVLLACAALAYFLYKRRKPSSVSPNLDDEEDPFSANINKYHTTNAAANF